MALLGPPPQSLLARGNLTDKFFDDDGESKPQLPNKTPPNKRQAYLVTSMPGTFSGGIPLPPPMTLEQRETSLEGEDKARFLRLVHKMLQWDAGQRSSAGEVIGDEWIQEHTRL